MRFLEKILPKPLCRKDQDYEAFRYRLVNTLSCISSRGVHQTLWNYLGYCRVPEEDRQYINMNSVFFDEYEMSESLRPLIGAIASSKSHYI